MESKLIEPLNNIIMSKLFDILGIDLMGLFTPSYGNLYILVTVAVEYMPKIVEVATLHCQ